MKYSLGEYSIADIKKSCISKNMQLWVKIGTEVEGAFITKISMYPQKNILCVLLLGGKEFMTWRDEADALLNAFGKENEWGEGGLMRGEGGGGGGGGGGV